MNRPSPTAMVVGHPIVAAPAAISGLVTLAACWQASEVLLGLLALGSVACVGQSVASRSAYVAWKREWDALNAPTRRPRQRGAILTWVVAALVLTGIVWFLGLDGDTKQAIVGVTMVAASPVAAFFALRWLWQRVGSRRTRRGGSAVAVVARPLFDALSLPQAYAGLPEHCQRILSSRPFQ